MSLVAHNLTFGYGAVPAVRCLSLTLQPGEVVGVVGPNGAGKSTLIKLLTRLLKPRAGRVTVNGQGLERVSRLELARLLAVVSQGGELPEGFTAHEVVMMGRTPHLGFLRAERADDYDLVQAVMRRTNTLVFEGRPVHTLSGGERQRVLFARALAQEPRYLLLDEPTNHLDLRYQVEVLRLVRREVARGLGALVVLHDLNLAARVCDKVLVMAKGAEVASGPPQSVLSAPLLSEVYRAAVRVFPQPGTGVPVVMPEL